jgi:hypothetical protein
MATTGKRGNPGTALTDNHNKVFMEQMDADATELSAVTTAAALNTTNSACTGVNHSHVVLNTADKTAVSVGVAGTNVTAVEYGGKQHMTVLTLTDVNLGTPTPAANTAHGSLIYTFPAGVHMHRHTWFSVGLTIGTVTTDAPDVGVGSVIGAGLIAVLNGGTMEDYVTGITWGTALDGSAEVQATIAATAGLYAGISNNAAADAKTVHFNVADGWHANITGDLTASGTVVLIWDTIA